MPDYDQYQNLFSLHSQTLTCRCSKISVDFKTFIEINYSIHQVCNSTYTSDVWIKYLTGGQTLVWDNDFRVVGIYQFQALRALCQLVDEIIKSHLEQFYSRMYIRTTVPSNQLFSTQANGTIEQFISTTINSFTFSLRMIRDITQVNVILSALMKNIGLYLEGTSSIVHSYAVVYAGTCNCAFNSQCVSKSVIYSDYYVLKPWYVPGFYQGCFILESLRQSRLECFYNQSCLEELNSHLGSNVTMNLIALDSSLSRHLLPNSTIGMIIDALMVDEWKWTISHASYYSMCKPTECIYQEVTKDSAISIITALIGVIGGLVTVLKLIVPRAVSIIMKVIHRKRRNAIQCMISSTTQIHQKCNQITDVEVL